MKGTRLIDILKTFSVEEIKSFEKFLLSPFVKSRRSIEILLRYLKKFHPDFESDMLSRETAFRTLFPTEKYNDKKIANLIFDLTKAAEDFLKHKAFENDEMESLLYLCKGYYDKKLFDYSMRVTQIIEGKMKPSFSIRKNYFEQVRAIENIKITYYEGKNDQENLALSRARFYEATAILFLIDYTWMMSDEHSHFYYKKREKNIVESIVQSFDIKKFYNMIGKSDSIHKSIISIHYYILKTLNEPGNLDYYFLLKELIFKNLSSFDHGEKFALLNHLENYAYSKINSGMSSFREESLEISLKILEHNVYRSTESEHLPVITYRNIFFIVVDGVIAGKKTIKFAEDFIEKYTGKIIKEEITEVKNFSYAYLNFYKKDFAKALDKISRVKHLNPVFKIDYRFLMLRIYYELNYFEQAFSSLDAFRHYLVNDKEISEDFKNEFRKFVIIYSELLKIKSGESKIDPVTVKKEFENLNLATQATWLCKKIDELIKKND